VGKLENGFSASTFCAESIYTWNMVRSNSQKVFRLMDFHLQASLDRETTQQKPRFQLNASNPTEFENWRAALRRELIEVLGLTGRLSMTVPQLEKLGERDQGSYIETKYRLKLDDEVVPLVLLTPKTPPPHMPILAFHGHGMGAKQILGHYPNQVVAEQMRAHDENYAQRLAEDGFLVCVVEQRGFGERVTDQIGEAATPAST